MDEEPVVVLLEDLKSLRFCGKGTRVYFQQFGLDYTDFLNNGVLSTTLLEKTGQDTYALNAIEVARGRIKKSNCRV